MDVIHKISLDFGREQIPPHISIMQKDTARKIVANLYENGAVWNVPVGASAYIAFCRPDGECIKSIILADGNSVVSVSENVATVAVPAELTEVAGSVPVVIVFVDANAQQIATFPISVSVLSNPAAESDEAKPATPDQFNQLFAAINLQKSRLDNIVAQRAEYVEQNEETTSDYNYKSTCKIVSNGISAMLYIDFERLTIQDVSASSIVLIRELPSAFLPLLDGQSNLFIEITSPVPARIVIQDFVSYYSVLLTPKTVLSETDLHITASYLLATKNIDEILDIRVGADGVTYPTAGDAVRAMPGAVRYTKQTLDDEQKEQARKNIGAISNQAPLFIFERNGSFIEVSNIDEDTENGYPILRVRDHVRGNDVVMRGIAPGVMDNDAVNKKQLDEAVANGGGGTGGGGASALIVTIDGDVADHDAPEIYEHTKNGGVAYLKWYESYIPISYSYDSYAQAYYIADDGLVEHWEIDGAGDVVHQTFEYARQSDIIKQLGDIDTALDRIIEIQNSLIGGDSE